MTSPLDPAARALALSQRGEECFDLLETEAQEALRENVRAVLASMWQPIETAPKDGTVIWAKRVHLGHIVKEGRAVWGVNSADAPMRQWQDGGLDEPIPPDNEYADTARWLTEDRRYSFPQPTHWLAPTGPATMKLEHLTDLRVTVDPDAYLKAAASKSGLWYLLDRLFTGESIAENELRTWGLRVTVIDEFIAVPRAE